MPISPLYHVIKGVQELFLFLETKNRIYLSLELKLGCKFELFFLELCKEETSYSFLNNYEGMKVTLLKD